MESFNSYYSRQVSISCLFALIKLSLFLQCSLNRLYEVAVMRGTLRDFSWNMIVWASFTAINTAKGIFQFFPSGEIDIMFDKPVFDKGYGSPALDHSTCPLNIFSSISDGLLSVTQNLNITYNETKASWNCVERSEVITPYRTCIPF